MDSYDVQVCIMVLILVLAILVGIILIKKNK